MILSIFITIMAKLNFFLNYKGMILKYFYVKNVSFIFLYNIYLLR